MLTISLKPTSRNSDDICAYRLSIQDTLFALSPLHYSTLSFIVTMVVAMTVSFATGKYKFVIELSFEAERNYMYICENQNIAGYTMSK